MAAVEDLDARGMPYPMVPMLRNIKPKQPKGAIARLQMSDEPMSPMTPHSTMTKKVVRHLSQHYDSESMKSLVNANDALALETKVKGRSIPWGDLRFVRNLAEGAFGRVDEYAWLMQRVAVKTLRLHADEEEEMEEMEEVEDGVTRLRQRNFRDEDQKLFADEIIVLASVNHANLVNFVGCSMATMETGEEGAGGGVQKVEALAMVVELCEGGTISSHIGCPAKQFVPADRLKWALDVCKGMHHLHEQSPPIIHRDLKPDNVLLSANGTAKVGDFGLSVINPKMKRLDEKARMAGGGGPDAAIFRSAGAWDTSGGQPTPIQYRPGWSANSNVASVRPAFSSPDTPDDYGPRSRGSSDYGIPGKVQLRRGNRDDSISDTESWGALSPGAAPSPSPEPPGVGSAELANPRVLAIRGPTVPERPAGSGIWTPSRENLREKMSGKSFGWLRPAGGSGMAGGRSPSQIAVAVKSRQERSRLAAESKNRTFNIGHFRPKPPRIIRESSSWRGEIGGVPVQNASAPDLPEVPDIMDHTAVAGTYRYMAPEVYNGVGYGTKVDVFSFGILLWELLANKLSQACWPGKHPIEIAMVMAKGDRPEIPAYWPEEIRTLLESCWHQEPDKRPTFGKALETIDSITVEIADRVLPPTKWWHVLVCGAC